MYAHGAACRPDEDRADAGAYCPNRSMVREPYDCIIGDAPIGAIPLGRVATVRGSLRRHAYAAIVEAMMSRRQSSAKPEGLSQLNLNAAGIDVGATSHYVAVPADRAEQSVQEFEAFTADLYRLADWLTECGVETVVMESTGVYWIPLFGVLEERGFQVMLVDPRRIKNVPGRKTDVLDCQWLQQLHTYGLLSGAFRPDGDIRRLRSYLRQRVMLVQYASHHIQHMQKALTQMNVKLHHVISNITGKTGTEIMEAIVGGQRDPRQLAQLRDPRIKADEATIAKSLQGHWREEHIFELTQALELYRFYQDKIAECDREIEAQLERFEDHSNGDPPAAKSGRRRSKGNAPRFDVWTHLYRMTGVDLTQIDGVDAYTALKVVSEIGTDMTKWPSAKHFASWLGLSPNNRITGGKVMRRPSPAPTVRRRHCVWRPTRCTAPTAPWAPSCAGRKPTWVRPRRSPPRPTSWPGSSTPCCAMARSTWMLVRNTTRDSISSGRCAPPSVGRPNWATNWYQCPTPGTAPRTHLPARQSPRDNVG